MSQRLLDRSRQLRLPQPVPPRQQEQQLLVPQPPVERPPLVRRPVLELPAVMPPVVLALPAVHVPVVERLVVHRVDLPVDHREALVHPVALAETAMVPVEMVPAERATAEVLSPTSTLTTKSTKCSVEVGETVGGYGVVDSGPSLTSRL